MVFRVRGEDEYDESNSRFAPAAADTYRVLVSSFKIISGAEAVSKYNEEGNDRVRFYLDLLHIEGDDEALLVDVNDNELDPDKFVIFFFDPDHLGLKPQVSKSRKFLASALNIPVEQTLESETLEKFCESLVGKTLVADVGVSGQYNNVLDTRPVVVKTRKRKPSSTPLVEAAEEVFAGAEVDDEEGY